MLLNLRMRRRSIAGGISEVLIVSKPKILVTRLLYPAARTVLEKIGDVDYWTGSEAIPRAEFLKRVADKDALVCVLTDRVDAELLAAAPKLRIAATVSVGYDNIDVAACTAKKVIATNTPGVLDDTTADFAWALLLAIARRLVEGDAWVRTGKWPGFAIVQLLGGDVYGKTLGIIGFGRIGQCVARRAAGFQMRVIYSGTKRAPADVEKELNAQFVEQDKLFAEADFVSLHVPLTPQTRHLICKESLEKMKRTAFLVNTSRGPVVDEEALADALESKKIAGAALDVYEHEPKVNPKLSATVETRTRMMVVAANNVAAFFEGRTPANALNKDQLGLK
jgi:glyoxylate reductase